MSARRHFLSLFSQSPLSPLLLFNHLRTLPFSVSSLSPALPITSALLPPKRGVHPLRSHQSHGFPMRSDHSSSSPAVDCQLSTVGSPLTPFTATLTQKQGGYPSWSFQFPATEQLRSFTPSTTSFTSFSVHRPFTILLPPLHPSFSLSCLLLRSPPIHNPVTAPSPIFLPLLSQ